MSLSAVRSKYGKPSTEKRDGEWTILRLFVNRREMPQDIVVINPQSSSGAKP
jgi:hypothetical protein